MEDVHERRCVDEKPGPSSSAEPVARACAAEGPGDGRVHERGPREPSRPFLECFHQGAGGPAFIFLPSLYGLCLEGADLSRRLPPEVPCYGLSVRGTEPYWKGCESLNDIARGLIETLVATGPLGPCILAGYSFGGRLAFEMARQMRVRGLEVQNLVIMDTGMRTGTRRLRDRALLDIPSMISNLPAFVIHRYVKTAPSRLRRLFRRLRARLTNLGGVRDTSHPADFLAADHGLDGPDTSETRSQRYEASWNAFRTYQPEIYRGDAVVIRCNVRPLRHIAVPDLGWGRWIDGRVTVVAAPGNHASLRADAGLDFVASVLLALTRRSQPAPGLAARDYNEPPLNTHLPSR